VNRESSELDEVKLYEQVAEELEREYQVKGLWVKALSETENDFEKAKARYIKLRVKMLKEERRVDGDRHSIEDQTRIAFWKNRESKDYAKQIKKDSGLSIDPNPTRRAFFFELENGVCIGVGPSSNSRFSIQFNGGFIISVGAGLFSASFGTTLFEVQSAAEKARISDALEPIVKDVPFPEGQEKERVGWLSNVCRAVMICRTEDEIVLLFNQIKAEIDNRP